VSQTLGRIVKGVGGSYEVSCNNTVYTCAAKGIFRKKGITPLIGDRVEFEVLSEDELTGNVVNILERTNSMVRPRVANIDRAVVVFSVKRPAINVDLLDRFLILAEFEGIDAMIVLNKCDISDKAETELLRRTYEDIGYTVVLMSAVTLEGLDEFRRLLRGKVSVLAGPSGVGKSSIVNCVSPKLMETGELSRKIDRGKHTTRHAELLRVDDDTFIVDSPGFTSLAVDGIGRDDIAGCFREFAPFAQRCRFNDCKHLREPGCAVKEQVGHAISADRYERYERLVD